MAITSHSIIFLSISIIDKFDKKSHTMFFKHLYTLSLLKKQQESFINHSEFAGLI